MTDCQEKAASTVAVYTVPEFHSIQLNMVPKADHLLHNLLSQLDEKEGRAMKRAVPEANTEANKLLLNSLAVAQ